MLILIPAYEPDHRLLDLLFELRSEHPEHGVVVVDDGSGPDYSPIFARARLLGAHVLAHPVNLGKGAALRTGLHYIHDCDPTADVVCADSDGQHLVRDILRVAD
ncbi:MAG: glycosyltransferase, partial [Candidatus Nanopelagicales bacterium]